MVSALTSGSEGKNWHSYHRADVESRYPEEISGHCDALGNCVASHTETTSPTMQSETVSGKPSGPMKTS